jgi:hypothetical protein
MPVVLLSIVIGAALFAILTATVAVWWIAAVAGLFVVLLACLLEAALLINQQNQERYRTAAYR